MSATTSSSDKLLFLFSTDSDDLSGIKTALQDYYKFPAANTFEATGCNNFVSTYKSVIEKLRGTDPDPTVNTYQIPDAAGLAPGSETKTLTLVAVISGNADSSGLYDNLGGTPITWDKIRQTLSGTIPNPLPKNYPYQNYCEIQVIFASPYCNSFLSAWDGGVPVSEGTLTIAPTVLDQISQSERETFLNSIAAELELGTSTILDAYGRISFNDIAASVHGSSVGSYFRSVGTGVSGKFFPGYSYFEIHDGNPSWWESDDIYINSYGNDFYNVGSLNTVFVNVHTVGTHPVKDFWLGVKLFWSGLGPAETMKIAHLVAGSTLPSVLKGGESYLYHYDVTFTTSTHRCIVARAKFSEIHDTEIDDYSEWSIEANADEAQRNIDPAPVPPPPPMPAPPAPDPGDGQDPDPDPQPDPGDQNNTGDRSLWNIRGVKEHIYSILNTFREKRRFRIALHKEFPKTSGNISFFRMYDKKLVKLNIVYKPYPHVEIGLESGEKADILFYLASRPTARKEKEIKLPFEIMAEIKGKRPVKPRRSNFMKLDEAFAPAGGLTVKIYAKEYSINGHVYDRKGRPVPGAKIFIRTVNGRQAAVIKTDVKGAYHMPYINPDAYRMHAEIKNWSSGNRIVNLFSRNLNIDFMEGKD